MFEDFNKFPEPLSKVNLIKLSTFCDEVVFNGSDSDYQFFKRNGQLFLYSNVDENTYLIPSSFEKDLDEVIRILKLINKITRDSFERGISVGIKKEQDRIRYYARLINGVDDN